jgi:hypothetical protein
MMQATARVIPFMVSTSRTYALTVRAVQVHQGAGTICFVGSHGGGGRQSIAYGMVACRVCVHACDTRACAPRSRTRRRRSGHCGLLRLQGGTERILNVDLGGSARGEHQSETLCARCMCLADW